MPVDQPEVGQTQDRPRTGPGQTQDRPRTDSGHTQDSPRKHLGKPKAQIDVAGADGISFLGSPHRKGKSFEGDPRALEGKRFGESQETSGKPKAQINVVGADGTGREKVVRGGFDFTRVD